MSFFGRPKPKVDWYIAQGRVWLTANGYAVAMEGDPLRDPDLIDQMLRLLPDRYYKDEVEIHPKNYVWTSGLIKWLVAQAED